MKSNEDKEHLEKGSDGLEEWGQSCYVPSRREILFFLEDEDAKSMPRI